MESKEKCEQIIQMFNGTTLPGAKEPLLVKFADGGQKKRSPFRNENRMWREGSEVSYRAIHFCKLVISMCYNSICVAF